MTIQQILFRKSFPEKLWSETANGKGTEQLQKKDDSDSGIWVHHQGTVAKEEPIKEIGDEQSLSHRITSMIQNPALRK